MNNTTVRSHLDFFSLYKFPAVDLNCIHIFVRIEYIPHCVDTKNIWASQHEIRQYFSLLVISLSAVILV